MNAKIKGAMVAETGVGKREVDVEGEDNGAEEEEWIDEDVEEMVDVGGSVGDGKKVTGGEGMSAAVKSGETVATGVDDGVS